MPSARAKSPRARAKSPATAGGEGHHGRFRASPRVLGAVICCLLCITTTQYFFAPPMKSGAGARRRQGAFEAEGVAFWGGVDGEFDWCELNYQHQIAGLPVAELVNTLSSLLYFIPPCYVLLFAPSRGWWSFGGKLNFVLVGLIAVGTTLFHASLRYWAQLVDELPIYWVMLNGCLCLFRIDKSLSMTTTSEARFSSANRLVLSWAIGLTMGLFVTLFRYGREGFEHQLFRGVMSCSFSLCFAGLFYGTARMIRKLETWRPRISNAEEAKAMVAEVVADADALFAVSYVTIILAVICWISDNALCDQLLHLPFGIPYPQTHSLWHVFTTWCVCLCARDNMRTRQHILECFVANVHACMLVFMCACLDTCVRMGGARGKGLHACVRAWARAYMHSHTGVCILWGSLWSSVGGWLHTMAKRGSE